MQLIHLPLTKLPLRFAEFEQIVGKKRGLKSEREVERREEGGEKEQSKSI